LSNLSIVYCQTLKTVYFYVWQVLGRAPDLLDPFLYSEQRGFAGVFDYRNNYPIEQFRSSLDNVCVTEGNGVKAAWIDCNHEFGSTEWGGVGEWGSAGEWECGSGRKIFPLDLILSTSIG
jgi:hypothetical protein